MARSSPPSGSPEAGRIDRNTTAVRHWWNLKRHSPPPTDEEDIEALAQHIGLVRERIALRLLGDGKSVEQIATEVGLSVDRVDQLRSRALERLAERTDESS